MEKEMSIPKIDVSKVKHGIVCFTFDDSRYSNWLAQQELFAKYHAHATFFFDGMVSDEMLAAMRRLCANGHSIGLHSLSHEAAPPVFEANGGDAYLRQQVFPQLDVCRKAGMPIHSFAYPNNRRNEETDRALAPYFHRFRAGLGMELPKGYRIAEQDAAFHSLDNLAATAVLRGNGIGDYYAATTENLDAALERAARENMLVVFFSHGISADATGVHMKTALLEHCLEKASALGMMISGVDELP